jgi:hypothetical protein
MMSPDVINMLIDVLKNTAYTFFTAVIGVMLNWIELFILLPPDPESVWSIQYELFLAAFGILWAAHLNAPDELVRWVFQPMAAIGFGLLACFVFMGMASPVQGLPWPAGLSFAEKNDIWFTIILPDSIGVFVLFWAVVVARRIQLQG